MRDRPGDDLSGFRWHTGATLRPLAEGEPCPVLFRDIGPAALALFLRGELPRLAGPLSPIVYMRTEEYVEPYTDFEKTGRLAILQPPLLGPWHSGLRHIYVCRSRPGVDFGTVGFVPGEVTLADAAGLLKDVTDTRQLREAFGGKAHDEAAAESLHQLERLEAELAATEQLAGPLRKALQSPDRREREEARERMTRAGLTEPDLCTAWHHIPRDRREWIAGALRAGAGRIFDASVTGGV
jgi:hypothetical protein